MANDAARRRVGAEHTAGNPGFRIALVDVLLALFVCSALTGTQTAYAPGPAWTKFALIAGAWGLYYGLRYVRDLRQLHTVLAAGGLLGIALAVYFFIAYNWDAAETKVAGLTALGKLIAAPLPRLTVPGLNPNIVGGVLAMVLPGCVFLMLVARRDMASQRSQRPARRRLVFWTGTAGILLLTVLVTSSRGAWLGTLAGFVLWGVWTWLGRRFSGASRVWWLVGVSLVGLIVAVIFARVVLAYDLPGAAALNGRLALFRSALPLARDYVLTGAGLDTFQMNFSIYTLLIHVGYIPNGHNVFVDLLVEQGVLGLTLYLSLVALCVWQGLRALHSTSRKARLAIEVGLVSLVVTLVHGQVEDILYGSRWVMLLFVPFALIQRGVTWTKAPGAARRHPARRWALVAAGVFFVVAAVFWRPLLAQGYASWGAMQQARLELARYEFGKTPGFVMDAVRQQADLGESIALFERAITLDPGNATACQRLAGIDLSRGAYDAALRHIQAAWAAGHRDAVTRLLLGDALVAHGRIDEAAEVVSGLVWAQTRLEGQAWSRYWENGDFTRAAYVWRTVALLQPESAESALLRAREAEIRATE